MKVDFVRADHVGVDFEEIDLVGKPKDVCDMQCQNVYMHVHTWKGKWGGNIFLYAYTYIYTSV